jgi:hypothetical protein
MSLLHSAAWEWGVDHRSEFSGQERNVPSPRQHAAAVALPTGVFLFGGARCVPGCACFGDAHQLTVAPLAVALLGKAGLPTTVPADAIDAASVGMRWSSVDDTPLPQRGDVLVEYLRQAALMPGHPAAAAAAGTAAGAVGESALTPPWRAAYAWAAGAAVGTSDGGVLRGGQAAVEQKARQSAGSAPAPPARYRHSLASDHRSLAAAVRGRAEALVSLLGSGAAGAQPAAAAAAAEGGQRTRALLELLVRPYPLPAVAVAFGGESYGPSTYYDDTWVFVDAPTGAAMAHLLAGAPRSAVGNGPAALRGQRGTSGAPPGAGGAAASGGEAQPEAAGLVGGALAVGAAVAAAVLAIACIKQRACRKGSRGGLSQWRQWVPTRVGGSSNFNSEMAPAGQAPAGKAARRHIATMGPVLVS